ncbi:MAG: 50S ribosomal protein L24 [Lentisphaerae bacterium]|nr:50S ribosomal protein L24 [Lentisphaerota bacterium]
MRQDHFPGAGGVVSRLSKLHIRKDDIVTIIAGDEKGSGKTGKVLAVMPERRRALVEGMNFIKKTLRKTQDTPKGGIVEKEASMAISNLLLFCPKCKKGVRTARVVETGKASRKCRKCGHLFDA